MPAQEWEAIPVGKEPLEVEFVSSIMVCFMCV